MRISDWSSDVCSSDLQLLLRERPLAAVALQQHARLGDVEGVVLLEAPGVEAGRQVVGEEVVAGEVEVDDAGEPLVTEEHVVGEEVGVDDARRQVRSEEHTSELQSLMRISYAVFCLKQTSTYLKSMHSC